MIVVDASAVLAILLQEPEQDHFRELLLNAPKAGISPVGYWEVVTKLRRARGDPGLEQVRIVIENLGIEIIPATATTALKACEAEARYGKRTPANLNLGDCFAYALAVEQDAPLLFKGDDFAATDVRRA